MILITAFQHLICYNSNTFRGFSSYFKKTNTFNIQYKYMPHDDVSIV